MIQTRSAYIQNEKTEMLAEGLTLQDINGFNFDNEYYNLLIDYIKAGNKITNEVYNDLPQGQQYHFTKHYNFNNDKIIDSDYQQELEKSKKHVEENYNKYLSEQQQKQQEQDLKEQKEKQNTIRELTKELEQQQNKLFDYSKLSPRGKMNIPKYEHEHKQRRIKESIKELENKLKMTV